MERTIRSIRSVRESGTLGYFAAAGAMTAFDRKHAERIAGLPSDVKGLTGIVQGLVIHQHTAQPFYGAAIPEQREAESHLRTATQLLDAILAASDAPLATPRAPEDRLVGVCHHYAKLLTAFLRAKGIPTRVRYGFGDYFNPGFHEDHSLCECWSAQDNRWVLVDPQFDGAWQHALRITHDVFDVPRDKFLVAGDAWVRCRSGAADPATFGIFKGKLRGLWFVAGSILKDLASLNKMEMLQWDAWAGMPRPDNKMRDRRRLERFDELAKLTQAPDRFFKKLRRLYTNQANRLSVPNRVFNAMRQRVERI